MTSLFRYLYVLMLDLIVTVLLSIQVTTKHRMVAWKWYFRWHEKIWLTSWCDQSNSSLHQQFSQFYSQQLNQQSGIYLLIFISFCVYQHTYQHFAQFLWLLGNNGFANGLMDEIMLRQSTVDTIPSLSADRYRYSFLIISS